MVFELVVNDGLLDSPPARVTVAVENVNRAPQAGDQSLTTLAGIPVSWTLEAADPDNDPLSFAIVPPVNGVVTGTAPDLTYTPAPGFAGLDRLTVTVRDPDGLEATATVEITVGAVNRPPLASAGADQSANEGSTVMLDGSGSIDPDGDPLTFAWSQVAGPAVTLTDRENASPMFTAPEVAAGGATLTFRLVVADAQASSEPAHVNITIKNVNHAPVAHAGAAQRVGANAAVTLNGSLSYDPDGDPLTYAWRQVDGAQVDLTGADTAQAAFIAPVLAMGSVLTFELTVSDGVDDASARVAVTVDPVNHAPTADAGPDQTVHENDAVVLDGRGSSDPDGDTLTYRWKQVSGPAVVLSSDIAPKPTFTAPIGGPTGSTLAFDLRVNDGVVDSLPDRVTIRVLDVAHAPVCSEASASPAILWPPNHKLITVRIAGLRHGDDQSPRRRRQPRDAMTTTMMTMTTATA